MNSFEQSKAAFTHLVPELTRMASAAFRDRDPDAREEAVQNTLALAWHAYAALIERWRGVDEGIIKSVLWFSARQTRAGRTLPSGGDTKPKCAFEYAKRGRVKFERLALKEFVSNGTPVPDAVAFRIDVPEFLATLTDRQQRMAEALMTGESTSAVAKQFGVTPGAVSQFRVRFKELFDAFMGA
jgi:hypothetical protein